MSYHISHELLSEANHALKGIAIVKELTMGRSSGTYM